MRITMRYRTIITMLLIVSMSFVLMDNIEAGANYPQIFISIDSGGTYNMSWQSWSNVMDIISDTYDADWGNNSNIDYILFDKNIDGVNRYGADFIQELKKISSIDLLNEDNVTLWTQTMKSVILNIQDLDSDGDGYSNEEELNAGSLPGFSDDTPEDVEVDNTNMEFAVIGILIISVIILYFVFNRT